MIFYSTLLITYYLSTHKRTQYLRLGAWNDGALNWVWWSGGAGSFGVKEVGGLIWRLGGHSGGLSQE